MDDELIALLNDTHQNLGFLEGIIQYAPNNDSFRELMLFKECVYSKMIDYALILNMALAFKSFHKRKQPTFPDENGSRPMTQEEIIQAETSINLNFYIVFTGLNHILFNEFSSGLYYQFYQIIFRINYTATIISVACIMWGAD